KHWVSGDHFDREMVVRLGGLLPNDTLQKILKEAIADGNRMEDLAFERMMYLHDASQELISWVRKRLADDLVGATTNTQVLRLRALAERLPKEVYASNITRRCLSIREGCVVWRLTRLDILPRIVFRKFGTLTPVRG